MNRSRDDEYAEAYRRGYERARQGAEPTVRLDAQVSEEAHGTAAHRGGENDSEPTQQIGLLASAFAGLTYDGHDDAAGDRTPDDRPLVDEVADHPDDGGADQESRRRVLKGAALGGVALLLVVGAFGVGRLVADDTATAEPASESEQAVAGSGGAPAEEAYDGPVNAVGVARSSATCQSAASVDAAGNPVTYQPARAHDSDLTTAWRCDGSGVGQRITLELPRQQALAEVGLVPGYAKTDPANGVDRYAENNRITRVRWRFDDGATFVQRMSADPGDRSMRTMRIPVTETSRVVIEILGSQRGPRDTVAISEIRVAAPVEP
ncbi:MAG TPA: hypothetical protein VFY11_11595 [Nocardioidaceae bacterium]|nr:hypothetical protein [Nocardioidaceae bacterium]